MAISDPIHRWGGTWCPLGLPHLPWAMIRLFNLEPELSLPFLFFWLIGSADCLAAVGSILASKGSLSCWSRLAERASWSTTSALLLDITPILFVPEQIGLAIGDVFTRLVRVMLLAFPLLAAFVFVCTALTYPVPAAGACQSGFKSARRLNNHWC